MYMPIKTKYYQMECKTEKIAATLNELKGKVHRVVKFQVIKSDKIGYRIILATCEVIED